MQQEPVLLMPEMEGVVLFYELRCSMQLEPVPQMPGMKGVVLFYELRCYMQLVIESNGQYKIESRGIL
jgi:hypothetical protein